MSDSVSDDERGDTAKACEFIDGVVKDVFDTFKRVDDAVDAAWQRIVERIADDLGADDYGDFSENEFLDVLWELVSPTLKHEFSKRYGEEVPAVAVPDISAPKHRQYADEAIRGAVRAEIARHQNAADALAAAEEYVSDMMCEDSKFNNEQVIAMACRYAMLTENKHGKAAA